MAQAGRQRKWDMAQRVGTTGVVAVLATLRNRGGADETAPAEVEVLLTCQ